MAIKGKAYTQVQRRRVVITGIGAVSPLGLDMENTWQGLVEGRSGVGPITQFDASALQTRIAASVKGFDAERYLERREARRAPRFVQFAVAAAAEAVEHAQLDLQQEDRTRIGVEIGSALGGVSLVEEQRTIFNEKGPGHINPSLIPTILLSAAACMVSIRFGLKGIVNAPVAACATGTVAVGQAFRRLAYGDAEVMVAGGTDSVMTPLAITGFSRLGAASTKNDCPEQACAPFDANRDGAVAGEGAAIAVLETLEHALQRKAPILAEVGGFGFTADAFHIMAPDLSGEGAARAIKQALEEAGLTPQDLSWIGAHGTATKLNDVAETKAIKLALGEAAYRIPVSSNKGALGHMLGAAGTISILAGVKAIQEQVISPTINYHTPDPECDLDYVPNHARKLAVNAVLVNSFGFGGQNACLVVRRWDEQH